MRHFRIQIQSMNLISVLKMETTPSSLVTMPDGKMGSAATMVMEDIPFLSTVNKLSQAMKKICLKGRPSKYLFPTQVRHYLCDVFACCTIWVECQMLKDVEETHIPKD